KYPEKVRLNEMRKDFFDFLKLPPSPEGVIKKSPLGDLGVILMNFLRCQNLFSDTNRKYSYFLQISFLVLVSKKENGFKL
ncbi:hypothetical protein, partial [Reichenbachiella sp. MALMAid0571]|uniref:hypothetical protein n=1 Tax=Reichenbachiella sp. MALMAid0571 TaxID=3143939 RepID=UPI0032DEA645